MILPPRLYLYRTYDLTTLTPASEGTEEKKKKGNKVDGPKTGPHGGGTVIFKYRLRSGSQIERGFSSSCCWENVAPLSLFDVNSSLLTWSSTFNLFHCKSPSLRWTFSGFWSICEWRFPLLQVARVLDLLRVGKMYKIDVRCIALACSKSVFRLVIFFVLYYFIELNMVHFVVMERGRWEDRMCSSWRLFSSFHGYCLLASFNVLSIAFIFNVHNAVSFQDCFIDLMRRIRELWFMVVRFQVGQILQVVVSCFKVRLSLSAFDLD